MSAEIIFVPYFWLPKLVHETSYIVSIAFWINVMMSFIMLSLTWMDGITQRMAGLWHPITHSVSWKSLIVSYILINTSNKFMKFPILFLNCLEVVWKYHTLCFNDNKCLSLLLNPWLMSNSMLLKSKILRESWLCVGENWTQTLIIWVMFMCSETEVMLILQPITQLRTIAMVLLDCQLITMEILSQILLLLQVVVFYGLRVITTVLQGSIEMVVRRIGSQSEYIYIKHYDFRNLRDWTKECFVKNDKHECEFRAYEYEGIDPATYAWTQTSYKATTLPVSRARRWVE